MEMLPQGSSSQTFVRARQKRRRLSNLWVGCGVVALLALCGVGVYAFLWFDPLGLFPKSPGADTTSFLTDTPPALAATQTASPVPLSMPTATTPAVDAPAVAVVETPQFAFQNPLIPYEAVVKVLVTARWNDGAQQSWWGSGTLISPEGLILTSAHVVASSPQVSITQLVVALCISPDQVPQPRYRARIMQIDQNIDIAILQIDSDLDGNPVDTATLNLPWVPLGNSDALRLGDALTILGYPEVGGPTITLTRGEVAGFTAQEGYGPRAFIKTTATITGGNSGGGVFNSAGELVGMPTQIGQGAGIQYADCRRLADTNNDGVIDESDTCIPVGGYVNSLRPIFLLMPFIEAALRGEANYVYTTPGIDPFIPIGMAALTEDFSSVSSIFPEINAELYRTYYYRNAYWMELLPGGETVSVPVMADVSDASVSITVQPAANAGRVGFGVLCRSQGDEAYGFEVSSDGYFSIWRKKGTEHIFLSYWQYSDLAAPGEPVVVGVSCSGSRLSLAAGYRVLVEVEDETLSTGSLELFLNSYSTNSSAAASFDNLMVFIP